MRDRIILLMGESGSGKTCVSRALIKKYGWKDIESYTTRPPRKKNEHGHIFISEEEFDKIPEDEMCAYTLYNGNRYCATNEQVNNADIYVIDPAGVIEFKKKYKGSKTPVVVYLEVTEEERKKRMLKRGDSSAKADERIELDRQAFKAAKDLADRVVSGMMQTDTIARRLYEISKGR